MTEARASNLRALLRSDSKRVRSAGRDDEDQNVCMARIDESEEVSMGQPRTFEHRFRVDPRDIDRQGHVNNIAYLRFAQDAAVAHWMSAASEEQIKALVWVARRHEIDYLRPAFQDEELVARTWVGSASGATYERMVEIRRVRDDELLVKVKSLWVPLDAQTRRPKRVSAELRARFEDEQSDPGANAAPMIPD